MNDRVRRLLPVNQQPLSRALSQELTLQALDAWGRTVELPATFGYDAGDPWAVRITFAAGRGGAATPVRWVVGRELLLQGLTDPAGEGDVQLFPSVDEDGRAAVVIELCSPDGRLVLQLRTSDLYRFLSRTLAVVPLGTEAIDLDDLVDALVGRSDAQ
jgi:hypothetical protein